MKSYGAIERLIGKKLDAFPVIRHNLKNAYQHANYYLHKEKDFKFEIRTDISIKTPKEWTLVDDDSKELFFGYYDKTPWDGNSERLLYHEICINGLLKIIMFDKKERKRHYIGTSYAWNYQQGAMLQWLPNSEYRYLIYNDFRDGNLISVIFDTKKMEVNKIINAPIQTLNPNGNEALTLNYKRLFRLRAQYGYSVNARNYNCNQPYTDDGIWKINLLNGNQRLVITLDRLINNIKREEMKDAEHKINHIIYSPNGDKFVFMHRWLGKAGKFSRLYVSDSNGEKLDILMDTRMVSHYSWYDDTHVVAWARTEAKGDQYYLINVDNGDWVIIGEGVLNNFGDGHPSFSPNKEWMITDTYPDKARQRHLLLYNIVEKDIIHLGRFFAPIKFNWDIRVDLHPRWSPDGNLLSIDSCHEGKRYSYIIDLSKLVG